MPPAGTRTRGFAIAVLMRTSTVQFAGQIGERDARTLLAAPRRTLRPVDAHRAAARPGVAGGIERLDALALLLGTKLGHHAIVDIADLTLLTRELVERLRRQLIREPAAPGRRFAFVIYQRDRQ